MRKLLLLISFLVFVDNSYAAPIIIGPVANGEILATTFANLSTAVHSPVLSGKTLLVTTPMTCNNLTVPSNVGIHVSQNGQINVNSGNTFTASSIFAAGLYNIFNGSGTISNLPIAYPEWWTTNTTPGTTDMTTAINNALTSSHNVSLSPTTYKVTSAINMLGTQTLTGVIGQTIIQLSNTDGIHVTGGAYNSEGLIQGIIFDGLTTNPPVVGGYNAITVWDGTTTIVKTYNMHIIACSFQNIMGGIYLRTAWQTVIERNTMGNVPMGIQIIGLTIETKILNNVLNQYNGGAANKTGSVGVNLNSYSYTSGGGVQQPQDTTIEGNQIYTYETGVAVGLGILTRILHNMIDVCSLYGVQYQADSDLIISQNWIGVTGPTTATVYGIYANSNASVNTAPSARVVIRDNYIFENSGSSSSASTGFRAQQYSVNVLVEGNRFSSFKSQDIDLTNIVYPIFILNNQLLSTVSGFSVNIVTYGGGYVVMDKNQTAGSPIYMHPTANTAALNDLGKNTGTTQTTYVKGSTTITSGNSTALINVNMGSNFYIYPKITINNIVSTAFPSITANVNSYGATSSQITLTLSSAAPAGGVKIYYEVQGIWYGDR